MARYDYRCAQDGVFELTLPLGTAPETAPCPECGQEAQRLFAAPLTAPPSLDKSGPFGMTRIPTPPGARPPGGMRPPGM
ncbi:MAG: zinc ribbon domain-containing protein [Thermoleophilia bacterium]